MCACAKQIFPDSIDLNYLELFKTTKISHSILIKMKITFFHIIPSYPMSRNHTATNLKFISSFYP